MHLSKLSDRLTDNNIRLRRGATTSPCKMKSDAGLRPTQRANKKHVAIAVGGTT
jgi:hypothetical protein